MAHRGSIASAVLLGGLIAGTVDIGAAALINGKGPDFIARVIAGGLLGRSALAGGAEVVALGVVLQWAMSMIIAAIWVAAALRRPSLRARWLPMGLAFGIPVFVVMEYVVLPLSAWGQAPKPSAGLAWNFVAMLVFGAIVAGVARWRLGPGAPRA